MKENNNRYHHGSRGAYSKQSKDIAKRKERVEDKQRVGSSTGMAWARFSILDVSPDM